MYLLSTSVIIFCWICIAYIAYLVLLILKYIIILNYVLDVHMKTIFWKIQFQREKDDAIMELDDIKNKFEITNSTQIRVEEEKNMMGKELDRLLEKYDR